MDGKHREQHPWDVDLEAAREDVRAGRTLDLDDFLKELEAEPRAGVPATTDRGQTRT